MMIPSYTPCVAARCHASPSGRGTERLREPYSAIPISPPFEGGVQGWLAFHGYSNLENYSLCFSKRDEKLG